MTVGTRFVKSLMLCVLFTYLEESTRPLRKCRDVQETQEGATGTYINGVYNVGCGQFWIPTVG